MRCYRVDEGALRGIPTELSGQDLYVEVGSTRVMLDSSWSDALIDTADAIAEELDACWKAKKWKGKRLDEETLNQVEGLLEEVVNARVYIMDADFKDGKLSRARQPSNDALVLVDMLPGERGSLKFTSTLFEEQLHRGGRDGKQRVYRRYSESFPPMGVTILAQGESQSRSKVYLLRMMPGSSLRIERSGRLLGAPRTFKVSWRGADWAEEPLLVSSPPEVRPH
jgi:hypothetical protein